LDEGEEKMEPSDSSKWNIRRLLLSSEFRIALAAVLIFAAFGLFNAKFFTEFVWRSVLREAADLSFLILGETLVITSGEIDLSVASTWALSALIFLTLVNAGIDPIICAAAVLVMGIGIGLCNGSVVVKSGVPSFVMTSRSFSPHARMLGT
jgi:ribose transport system permease protein